MTTNQALTDEEILKALGKNHFLTSIERIQAQAIEQAVLAKVQVVPDENLVDAITGAISKHIITPTIPEQIIKAARYIAQTYCRTSPQQAVNTDASVEQDAVDAARYRWLRNDCLKASSGVYGFFAPVVFNTDDCFNHSDEALMGEALDAEIDAARSRVEGEK